MKILNLYCTSVRMTPLNKSSHKDFPTFLAMGSQSIPKEINPEYSLEGLMLKLKLQ